MIFLKNFSLYVRIKILRIVSGAHEELLYYSILHMYIHMCILYIPTISFALGDFYIKESNRVKLNPTRVINDLVLCNIFQYYFIIEWYNRCDCSPLELFPPLYIFGKITIFCEKLARKDSLDNLVGI